MNTILNTCPNCFESSGMLDGWCGRCGYYFDKNRNEDALCNGMILNERYIIGRILGMGGFGITYLAYDTVSGKKRAIKEFYPRKVVRRGQEDANITLCQNENRLYFAKGLEEFENESHGLFKLADNQYIVNVYDYFRLNNTAYLVMEFIEGISLLAYHKSCGERTTVELADRMISCVGNALSSLHNLNLLHRDIGPDNIILDKNNQIKLIDFGNIRIRGSEQTLAGQVIVKNGYSPYEQYMKDGNMGPWSDIYSLAATYYFLLTNTRPFSAIERSRGQSIIYLNRINTQVSKRVSMAINRAMSLDWRERPKSIEEFLEEMELGNQQEIYTGQQPYLVMEQNGFKKSWAINSQGLTIGRDPMRCSIVIDNYQISGIHCRVLYDEIRHETVLIDYSRNGTFVDGYRLKNGESIILRCGSYFGPITSGKQYSFYMEVR